MTLERLYLETGGARVDRGIGEIFNHLTVRKGVDS